MIFKTCPNAIIPDVKFTWALKKAHATTPIIDLDDVDDGKWASAACASLRKVARMYRMTKLYGDQKQRVLKKALGMNVL